MRSGLTFLPHVSPRIPHSLSFPASSPHHNAQVMFPIGQGTRVWGRLEGFQERLLHTSAIPVCRISRQQSCYLSYFPFQTFTTSSSADSICQFIKEENGFQPFSPVYRKAESNGQESRFFCSCKFHTELVVPTSKRHQILTMASGCHNEHCVFFTPYYSSYLEV